MEIERKWKLETLLGDVRLRGGVPILQGYIVAESNEVRLRKKGSHYFITAKSDGTLSREEWETEIPRWVFEVLWPKTEGCRIEKIRYTISAPGGLFLEFDEYSGSLNGLVVLEIEFPNKAAAEAFKLPPGFRGQDVTNDKRYKNKNLALNGIPK
ncbi:MAG: CYTH domain-containing protein [Patescibacteria group bacterium]